MTGRDLLMTSRICDRCCGGSSPPMSEVVVCCGARISRSRAACRSLSPPACVAICGYFATIWSRAYTANDRYFVSPFSVVTPGPLPARCARTSFDTAADASSRLQHFVQLAELLVDLLAPHAGSR